MGLEKGRKGIEYMTMMSTMTSVTQIKTSYMRDPHSEVRRNILTPEDAELGVNAMILVCYVHI